MSNLSKRLILRVENNDIVYEKVTEGHPRKIGSDTYGRCHFQSFWNQMRFPPNVPPNEYVCPLIPELNMLFLMREIRKQKR